MQFRIVNAPYMDILRYLLYNKSYIVMVYFSFLPYFVNLMIRGVYILMYGYLG